ncbi:hypothetical protein BBP40_010555 [Aspergillus hancockii]|nr:hypothetical protein BBP40_010555 [Aspergillus hancockii]
MVYKDLVPKTQANNTSELTTTEPLPRVISLTLFLELQLASGFQESSHRAAYTGIGTSFNCPLANFTRSRVVNKTIHLAIEKGVFNVAITVGNIKQLGMGPS